MSSSNSTDQPSRTKGRGIITKKTGKGGKNVTADRPIVAKDERSIKAPTIGAKRVRNDGEEAGVSQEAISNSAQGDLATASTEPALKKKKLPNIPRKPQAGSSTTPSVANTKATPYTKAANRTATLPARPKGSEVDLNNQEEYNKLFGISTPSSASTSVKATATHSTINNTSSNYRSTEQKARELAAAREQARLDRDKEWQPANVFDLQAGGDRIRAYEAKMWEEKRYMYISQVASAWIMMQRPPEGAIPHHPPPPKRYLGLARGGLDPEI